MRSSAAALVLLALVAPVDGALAQDESIFIAFGDSITKADRRFDTQNRGGYPGRLQSMLRGTDPDAEVLNFGRNSERTAEGLSRLTSILASTPSDGVLIMEGTNDIDGVILGEVSFESVTSNLAGMGNKAANAGRTAYYATIIPRPPSARRDKSNQLTFALNREVRAIAFRQQRELVDPYDELIFTPGAFNTLYSGSDDLVGHPNSAGFAVLADLFFDVIRGIDSHGPVPGELEPGYQVPTIGPADDLELELYDLGAGIDATATTLTINGVAVETGLSGNPRRMILTHDTTAETLSCHARVGVRATDLADPPNVSDHVYAEYRVPGGNILAGDLNKSCRVDGVDLLIVSFAFGAQEGDARYSRLADINGDGEVNGLDVAALAANFGLSSS